MKCCSRPWLARVAVLFIFTCIANGSIALPLSLPDSSPPIPVVPVISNGTTVRAGNDPIAEKVRLSSVVLVSRANGGVCSGVLVSNRKVLTAGHCVDQERERPSVLVLFVTDGTEDLGTSDASNVETIHIHPHYKIVSPGADGSGLAQNDLAIIELKTPAPEAFKPIRPDTRTAPTKGDEIVVAGAGITKMTAYGTEGTLHYYTNRITSFGDGTFRSLREGGFSCEGDSGGPVFLKKRGGLILAGIVKAGNCNSTSNYTALSTPENASWLQSMGVD